MPIEPHADIWALSSLDFDAASEGVPNMKVLQVGPSTQMNDTLAAPVLTDLLFNQNDNPLRTYLLVDPTLRKQVTELFDLDAIDVPITCLFNGAAAEEQQEVAPYLIDMTFDEESPSLFHRDFFANHWGQGTGIFLRSPASLEELKKHFRRFTKLKRTQDDGWYFFRFWDPAIASVYFRTIADSQLRAAQWFGRDLIECFVVGEEQGKAAVVFDGGARNGFNWNAPIPPVVLTDRELAPFRKTALDRDIEKIAHLLKQDFEVELKAHTPEAVVRRIRPALARFMRFGFRRREHLHVIAAWAVFFGPEFDEKDPQGRLQAICTSQDNEGARFRALKERMAQLGRPEAAA
ncbi:DUF4123 domain-containing protein [uncultured Litoreibacter sp.]|uniref:DUF4123 domain-containing protein n=1 Tax=uncultured Litoreibacter sp. TaxID=1392394 RepID=UPI002623087A|nr:DUF4123 domain-containing protein [uncultured Litoreibacter sp.]